MLAGENIGELMADRQSFLRQIYGILIPVLYYVVDHSQMFSPPNNLNS